MVNDTLCWNFYPQNDDRVEANEVFSFNISTSNGLDTFLGVSLCDITIYDDDGKKSNFKKTVNLNASYLLFFRCTVCN